MQLIYSFLILFAGKNAVEVANHIIQFTFNGVEGFHFPFAYWPTSQINSSSLFHLYWQSVFQLFQHNFYVVASICDGAQANRSFILYHFKNEAEAVKQNCVCTNLVTGQPHAFIMDPSVSIFKLLGFI